MTNEKYGATVYPGDRLHFAKTFLLKLRVANGQYLVDHKNLRIEMRRDRKGEADIHSAAVMLHRGIEKLLDFCECDDFVEALLTSARVMPRITPLKKDVLAASQLGMKTGADLQQAGEPTANAIRPTVGSVIG